MDIIELFIQSGILQGIQQSSDQLPSFPQELTWPNIKDISKRKIIEDLEKEISF